MESVDIEGNAAALPEEQNKDWQRKQKRLGPAPIASFEDTLDEVRSKVCITHTHLL